MPLVTLNDILPAARRDGRAIGAFNIANYETAKAVIMAAEREDRPVIMQVYHRLMDDPLIGALAAMMRRMAEQAHVPVAVHLDHGASFDQVKLAVDCGFSSVMFDGSNLEFSENCDQTCRAAEYARAHNVSIEGEIGHVPMPGTASAPLSTPDEAAEFAALTGVDALAVAVGTAHGYYREQPRIDVDLARRIAARVTVPLVLHGGSGTPHACIRAVIKVGFAKVNVATEFQHAFQKTLAAELNRLGGQFMPVDKLMLAPLEQATGDLRAFIRLFDHSMP